MLYLILYMYPSTLLEIRDQLIKFHKKKSKAFYQCGFAMEIETNKPYVYNIVIQTSLCRYLF